MNATAPAAAAPVQRLSFQGVAVRLALVAVLIALDLWSKAAVFARLGEPMRPHPDAPVAYDHHGHPRELVLGDWLAFMTSLNPGAAWGFDRLPTHVLVYGRCAAVVLLLWLLVRVQVRHGLLGWALAIVLAGAAGNLHDNLFTEAPGRPFGMVRDFIDVYFARWDYHFPTFNVADSCITVGAVLLFLASWKKDPPAQPSA